MMNKSSLFCLSIENCRARVNSSS